MDERRLNLFSIGNSLLASVMVVCFVTAVNRAIGVFESAWFVAVSSLQPEMAVAAFLVAGEVQLSRRLLEPEPVFSREWWARFIPEWAFGLIGLLALVWALRGPRIGWNDIPLLSEKTAEVVRRPEFLEGLLLLIVVWGVSRLLTADLMAVENIPTAASRDALRGLAEEQHSIRDNLWQDVFFLGGAMVFLSVFSIPIAHFVFGIPLSFGSLGVETLLFFLCGFGLFVIGRLMILRAEWVTERTGVDPSVTRYWLFCGLVFVVLLLLLSAALPTEYSLPLLSRLSLLLDGIATLLLIVWLAAVYPLIWLLAHLFPALGNIESTAENMQPASPAARTPALPPGLTWEMVAREILFWGIAILIGIYLFRQVFPLRFSVVRRLRRFSLLRRLLDFLHRLRRRWLMRKNSFALAIRHSWEALREDLGGRGVRERGGFLNLRRLDPRQSIRFFFFALLRRGAERGTVRRPSQTPREYAALLSREEPLIRDELGELSRAFEEARYTVHPLGPQEAGRVRRVWDTIRSTLRSTRPKEGDSGGTPERAGGNRME
jgi:hypothetical protein